MKKTLALLLALLMLFATFSIAFVSCDGSEEEPHETEDEFNIPGGNNFGDNGNDGTGTSTDKTTGSSFSPASGTVYFLYSIKVRKDPKKSSQTSVGVIKYGASATLVEMNSTWSKVKFDDGGITKEGYVYNEVYTTNKAAVTVVNLETPVKATISGLGKKADNTPYTANIRTTPWNCSSSDIYQNVNVLKNIQNGKYSIADGYEVTKLGATESGEWIYIEYTATVDGTPVTERGYCHKNYITVEGETAPTPDTPSDKPVEIEPVF